MDTAAWYFLYLFSGMCLYGLVAFHQMVEMAWFSRKKTKIFFLGPIHFGLADLTIHNKRLYFHTNDHSDEFFPREETISAKLAGIGMGTAYIMGFAFFQLAATTGLLMFIGLLLLGLFAMMTTPVGAAIIGFALIYSIVQYLRYKRRKRMMQ